MSNKILDIEFEFHDELISSMNSLVEEIVEKAIDDIGDSLIQSEKFEEILNTTYASDFSDEFEYADNIISYLISDYAGTAIEEDLIDYIKDVYGEQLLDLYRSGDDSDNDGDDDLEYFV